MPSKMKNPSPIKIGVASCFMYPDVGRAVFGKKSLCYLEKDMGRFLNRENVMPVLIPDLEGEALKKFLDQCAGFVFQGGSDIAPKTYQETPIQEGKWRGDIYRDQYEFKIMDYALKNERPVLGICRGFQLMNVFFGGSLYQDLNTQKPESIAHRDAELYDQVNHAIEFSEGKLLAQLHQDDPVHHVNSVHHQGVKDLGKDLEVLAHCPEDGLVEAFHWQGAAPGKVMGVQWHPEFFYNSKTPLSKADLVYDKFLSFCEL